MVAIAAVLARREAERTGRQVGAGQIIDRAMRQYVAGMFGPEELAAMVRGQNGQSDD